jgi:hypothetical protein
LARRFHKLIFHARFQFFILSPPPHF